MCVGGLNKVSSLSWWFVCAGSERDQNNPTVSVKDQRHRWQIALNYTPLIRLVEVSDSRIKKTLTDSLDFIWWVIRNLKHWCPDVVNFDKKNTFCMKMSNIRSISVGVASPSLTWGPAPVLCQTHQPHPATSQLVLFRLLNLLTWV